MRKHFVNNSCHEFLTILKNLVVDFSPTKRLWDLLEKFRSGMALVLLLVGCLMTTLPLNAQESYTNKEKGYSVRFPIDWMKSEQVPGVDVVFISPRNPRDNKSDAVTTILSAELPEEVGLEEFFQANVKEASSVLKKFQIERFGTGKIAGQPSKSVVYTYELEDSPITIQQHFVIIDRMGYLLTFGASSSNYERYAPTFQAILESFQPIQKEAAKPLSHRIAQ